MLVAFEHDWHQPQRRYVCKRTGRCGCWPLLLFSGGAGVSYRLFVIALSSFHCITGLMLRLFTPTSKTIRVNAHKAGASFFILSRLVEAPPHASTLLSAFSQIFYFRSPLALRATAFVILILLLLYTFEGRVKTIVYTDTLQTTGMLPALWFVFW